VHPLPVSAAIGFIALSGQAAAAREASMKRLRTVSMKPMRAALGLRPMLLSHDIGVETPRPLAGLSAGLRLIDIDEARVCGHGSMGRRHDAPFQVKGRPCPRQTVPPRR